MKKEFFIMRKIILIVALAWSAINLTIGLMNGGDLSAPSIVIPVLLAIVMGLKKVTRKAG
jgi:hypothetical protein